MGGGTKRKREKDRMDPRKSRRPELPVTGPGRGGRVGASATQHVVQNLVRDTTRDEDVRPISTYCLIPPILGRERCHDSCVSGPASFICLSSIPAQRGNALHLRSPSVPARCEGGKYHRCSLLAAIFFFINLFRLRGSGGCDMPKPRCHPKGAERLSIPGN